MQNSKVRLIGNNLRLIPSFKGLIFRRGEGSKIYVIKHYPNTQTIVHKSEFEKAMAAYKIVSSKYRNALRELAK